MVVDSCKENKSLKDTVTSAGIVRTASIMKEFELQRNFRENSQRQKAITFVMVAFFMELDLETYNCKTYVSQKDKNKSLSRKGV